MVEYDPYAYEVHEDPYPVYRALRDEAPVYRNEALGFWALSRHADVLAAFKDIATLLEPHGVSLDQDVFHEQADATMSFLAMDPPRHTRMRALVSRGFTPRRVAELEPRIRAIAREHLDAFIERGRCDFIARLRGQAPDGRDQRDARRAGGRPRRRCAPGPTPWCTARKACAASPRRPRRRPLRMLQYFGEMLAASRRSPRDDLTAALVAAEIDGDRLSDREIIGFLFLMIVAGNETTTKLLGNAVYWLCAESRTSARRCGAIRR